MSLSVCRSGRANESVTRVLHTERPKTLPSIGLWVTPPLKQLLQLLLHRPLPAAAAPGPAPPGPGWQLRTALPQGHSRPAPDVRKRGSCACASASALLCLCSPSWGHPQAGAGVTLGLGAQGQASACPGGETSWTPLSVAGLSFRPYPGWAPDPFLSLVFNFTAKAPGRSIWEEVFP